jgi:hypothetical protein
METQWFSAFKEVQDTEVINQGVGVFWDRDGILHVDYLEKCATSGQSTTLHFSTN